MLEDEGILRRIMFGRVRLYRFDEHSAKSKAVQALMEVWEHADK